MKHNLETIKLKIRAYNTDRGSLQDIWDEWAAFEKELDEIYEANLTKRNAIWSKHLRSQAVGKRKMIKEIQGA